MHLQHIIKDRFNSLTFLKELQTYLESNQAFLQWFPVLMQSDIRQGYESLLNDSLAEIKSNGYFIQFQIGVILFVEIFIFKKFDFSNELKVEKINQLKNLFK